MATHFKWYGSDTRTTVPFNATYTYPSQANKTVKSTPRLPPKNGSDFDAEREIRIELPAMGYMNGSNSTLSFDVELEYTPAVNDSSIIRFQNNIQSIINRASIMYGSTPLEDIPEYNQLVRSMTEWTTTGDFDQGSVSEGIGHRAQGVSGYLYAGSPEFDENRTKIRHMPVNIRQAYIQGISLQKGEPSDRNEDLSGDGFGIVPYLPDAQESGVAAGTAIKVTRRYVVQLNLGILLQGKLLPLKYMASQLAIVLRLAPAKDCIFWQKGYTANAALTTFTSTAGSDPKYRVKNVVFIPEILEFDSSYDNTFLEGLQQGVPILFSSFNQYSFASAGSTLQTLSVPERNRSVKSVFTMQKRSTADFAYDSGATFYTTSSDGDVSGDNNLTDVGGTLQEYQYRIGGRYFPAAPVKCSLEVQGGHSNGGAEAYSELAKALGTLGDYRLSTPLNVLSWATPRGIVYGVDSNKKYLLPEYDGKYIPFFYGKGNAYMQEVESAGTNTVTITATGAARNKTYFGRPGAGANSCCFAMAINLETSNGMEISGLNAEEQSDISITMRWSHKQSKEDMQFLVYTYYDAMLVLFENNVVQLIK